MFVKNILFIGAFSVLSTLTVTRAKAQDTDRNPALLVEVFSGDSVHYGTAFVVKDSKYQTGHNLMLTAMHVVNEGSATGNKTPAESIKIHGWNNEDFGEAEVLYCGKGRFTIENPEEKAQQDICVLSIKEANFSYDMIPGYEIGDTQGKVIVTQSLSRPAPVPGASGSPLIIDGKVYGVLSAYSSKHMMSFNEWEKQGHKAEYLASTDKETLNQTQKKGISVDSECAFGQIPNDIKEFLHIHTSDNHIVNGRVAVSYGFPHLMKAEMKTEIIDSK